MTERAPGDEDDVDRHRQASLIAGALFVGSLVLIVAVMLVQVPRSFYSAKATVALVHEASALKAVVRAVAAGEADADADARRTVACGDASLSHRGGAVSFETEAGPSP